jgi:hypothetical protein
MFHSHLLLSLFFTFTAHRLIDPGGYTVKVDGTVIATNDGATPFSRRQEPIGTCPCTPVELLVRTDDRASETAYSLVPKENSNNDENNYLWLQNFGTLENDQEYDESACVDPTKCWRFDIHDSGRDGIQGEGYGIRLTFGGTVRFQGGQFGRGGFLLLGDAC